MGDVNYSILISLTEKRNHERQRSFELLWDNIETNCFWHGYSSLTGRESDLKKIEIQADFYHPTMVQFFLAFTGTIERVGDEGLRNILQYGASRRASSILRSVKLIMRTAPPDRIKPLSLNAAQRVSDCLLLIYVHFIGVIDAFSIALHRMNSENIVATEREADILNKKFRVNLKNSDIDRIYNENSKWLNRVKDELRNRFVHRVPPYVPMAIYSNEDVKKIDELSRKHAIAIKSYDLDLARSIDKEKSEVGAFYPVIAFVDNNATMRLHPTLLDDVFRFQVICLDILEVLVPKLQLRS